MVVPAVIPFVLSRSTTSDFVLRAAPHISEQYAETASKIRVAFTGDPSFFAYNGEEEEPEPEDPDAPPVERFREVHRLTYTVKVRPVFAYYNHSLCLFAAVCMWSEPCGGYCT
jgi:hypothetical protein